MNPGHEQVTQVCWVQESSLPSLAGFIKIKSQVLAGFVGFVVIATKFTELGLLGSLKQIKSQVLAGFAGFIAKATKFIELGLLGSRTQLTQLSWVH